MEEILRSLPDPGWQAGLEEGRLKILLSGDEPPPIAVLDWVMPGLTGVDVCQKVRARGSLSHLYIVVLTSKDRTEDLVAGRATGAHACR